MITDGDGIYLFTGLPQGNYQVRVDTDSAPIADSDLTGDPDTNGIPCTPDPGAPWAVFCDSQHEVEIRPGQVYLGADFGYQPTGVIGDYIWLDTNGDGIQDPDEGPIPFVTVNLYEWDGAGWILSETTETDSDGYYSFANLTAGTYRVEVDASTLPDGVEATFDRENGTDNPGNVVNDIVVDANGDVTSIGGIGCTDCNLEIDFGYAYAAGTHFINGYVFNHPTDTEGNPIPRSSPRAESGDLSYSNVTVYLWLQTNGSFTRIAETVTGSNGFYEFDNLAPGNYAVSVNGNDPNLNGNIHVTHDGVYTGESGIAAAENDGMVFEFVEIFDTLDDGEGVTDIDFGFAGPGNPTAVSLQSLMAVPGSQIILPWLAVMLLLTLTGLAVHRRRRLQYN